MSDSPVTKGMVDVAQDADRVFCFKTFHRWEVVRDDRVRAMLEGLVASGLLVPAETHDDVCDRASEAALRAERVEAALRAAVERAGDAYGCLMDEDTGAPATSQAAVEGAMEALADLIVALTLPVTREVIPKWISTGPIPEADLERAAEFVREQGWVATAEGPHVLRGRRGEPSDTVRLSVLPSVEREGKFYAISVARCDGKHLTVGDYQWIRRSLGLPDDPLAAPAEEGK